MDIPQPSTRTSERKRERWWLQCGVGCFVLLVAAAITLLILFLTLRRRGGHVQQDVLALIEKPRADPRSYQHATLKNGLQLLNIQDANSRFAAFALAVQAGSYDDPQELPGLAHFCEHMLFLGTERFPDPDGYRAFMAEHGGRHNAFTTGELTVYFGEVAHDAADEALERFADFFHAPLFTPDRVEKEVHAIDSEHAKNVQNPNRRVFETFNALADPASPSSRFHTGDLETLYEGPRRRNVSAVAELRRWFEAHYCPARMRLVTFGPTPLSQQLDAAQRQFGQLPTGVDECQAAPQKHAWPWPQERLSRWVVVQAQASQPEAELWLMFALPDLRPHYKSQPLEYVNYLISYGGEHSLQRVLSDGLGLVSSLSVMSDHNGAGTNFFIVFHTTPRGRDHPELVLSALFAYLAMARRVGVDPALYSTLADLFRLRWDWHQPPNPSDTVTSFAERMTKLPREHLLSGATRIDAPNSTAVLALLELLRPSNMNALLVTPTADERAGFRGSAAMLPHYGVRYLEQDLAQALGVDSVAQWEAWLTGREDASMLNARLATLAREVGLEAPFMIVPGPIDGVPTGLSLDNLHAPVAPDSGPVGAMFGKRPAALESNIAARTGSRPQNVEVWYRRGWVTMSPEVRLLLSLRPLRQPDEPEASVHDIVRVSLYSDLLMEELAPKTYDVSMTGASYSVETSAGSLGLSLSGFAPVLPKLAQRLLDVFKRFNVAAEASTLERERFLRAKEKLKVELQSFAAMPVTYAMQELSLLLVQGTASSEEKLQALENISTEDARASARELLFSRRLHVAALAMGNLGEREALEIVDVCVGGIVSGMGGMSAARSSGEVERTPAVLKLARPVEVRRTNPRKGDANHAVLVSLVLGVSTVEGRVKAALLAQILDPLAFAELRSRRQLGYVVQAGITQLSNVLALTTLVQSSVADADELEAAVESVLLGLMPERLQNLTILDVMHHKLALKQALLQPPASAAGETEFFWGPIAKGGVCFGLRDAMLSYLDGPQVTRETLIATWQEQTRFPRTKVAVKLFAGEVPEPSLPRLHQRWARQGLPPDAWPRLQQERADAVVLAHADAAERARLAGMWGYHPRDLHCELEAAVSLLHKGGSVRLRKPVQKLLAP